MEIGHQHIHSPKPEAGGDEDVGFPDEWLQPTRGAGRGFEQAQAGGPDGNDAAAPGFGVPQAMDDGLGEFTPFCVHDVVVCIVDLHGEERPCPDMQGDALDRHSAVGQLLQQALGEMEPRRRGRHGPVHRGVNGLVVGLVAILRAALCFDVGRKRHRAVGLDGFIELGTAELESQRDLAGLALAGDTCAERPVVAQLQPVEDLQPLGGTGEGAPGAGIDALVQVERHRGAVLAPDARALQFGGENAGVVDHQHVARLQDVQQVGNVAVKQRFAWANDQHASAVPRFGGVERYPIFRQLEIELGNEHRRAQDGEQDTGQAPWPGISSVPP